MLTEILIFIAVFLLLLQFFTQRRPPKFPPGPIGIPILGNLPFLGTEPHKAVDKLTKKYGKIFSLYFANYPVVFISDVEMMKEAFREDSFSGRPPLRPILERSWGKRTGIIFGEGKSWSEQRRFALKSLRDFGFGRSSMESIILEEVVDLIEIFKKTANKSISIERTFNIAVMNSLWHLIAGERYKHDDPKIAHLLKVLAEEFESTQLAGPIFFMPWFTKLFPKMSGWNQFMGSLESTFEFFQNVIDQHKVDFDRDNLRDFIDAYLKEMEDTKDPSSSFYGDEGAKSFIIVLLDLFVASFETVSTALRWQILYLILYPDVQKKLQAEIDTVIGRSRLPCGSDRPNMPYMEAFVNEVLRISFGPFNVFHSTTEDVKFRGYNLPKETIVMSCTWGIHHDPEIWGDPHNFRPERFIDSETGAYKRNEANTVFSTGKRACLGENLAREEMFLFLSGFLQHLTFSNPPNTPPPSEDPASMAIMFKPRKYNVIIQERN